MVSKRNLKRKTQLKLSKDEHGKLSLIVSVREIILGVYVAVRRAMNVDTTNITAKEVNHWVETNFGMTYETLIANVESAIAGNLAIFRNMQPTLRKNTGKVSYKKSKNSIISQRNGQLRKSKKSLRNIVKLPKNIGKGHSFLEGCGLYKLKGSLTSPISLKKEIKISRVWAMPSQHTFTIKPIAELLSRYVPAGANDWIDPFAGDNSPAEFTNDHNPEKRTKYHLEALDFVEGFRTVPYMHWEIHGGRPGTAFAGALFDPPYSYRQVSEHYKVIGKKATQLDTSTNFYNRVLNPLADIIKKGGYCISFGWNTNAMGKNRGFEIIEILIVAHGGHHNDTLVTVERKV